MGIDVELYFKTKDKSWDNAKTPIGKVRINKDEDLPEATHNIYSLTRLYDFGYERGHWPVIANTLLILFEDKSVKKIWYGGDCVTADCLKEMDKERFIELTKHYLEVGNEPYRSR